MTACQERKMKPQKHEYTLYSPHNKPFFVFFFVPEQACRVGENPMVEDPIDRFQNVTIISTL